MLWRGSATSSHKEYEGDTKKEKRKIRWVGRRVNGESELKRKRMREKERVGESMRDQWGKRKGDQWRRMGSKRIQESERARKGEEERGREGKRGEEIGGERK